MRIPYESCPLCGSTFHFLRSANALQHSLYTAPLPETMRWMQCDSCEHVFVDGYWSLEALEILFSKTHEGQSPRTPSQEMLRVVNARLVDRLTYAIGHGPGDWLDVGFGSGALLFTAQEFGHSVAGIDLRKQNVADATEMGLTVFDSDIESFAKVNGDSFDVVSLADVIEHTPFPSQTLLAANDLLRQNGLLFLSCPNMDTVIWRSLDLVQQNPYWFEIEHYHNFTRQRMYDLLEECGFEVLHYGISERYRTCMEIICRVS